MLKLLRTNSQKVKLIKLFKWTKIYHFKNPLLYYIDKYNFYICNKEIISNKKSNIIDGDKIAQYAHFQENLWNKMVPERNIQLFSPTSFLLIFSIIGLHLYNKRNRKYNEISLKELLLNDLDESTPLGKERLIREAMLQKIKKGI
ncbi:uncharacterized protein CMU_015840 [Cryptosporidium muris RN66]|uniref:Uncharacterized protein n=1 Tax=Cryptosporidium muris (strain RN66) TaxID=441375 RepID=B6ACI3_CRYMR|nr:uncharacterized protein CMU_015840 [Cryptosporidium muris RN66]EEA05837.1 hypothetical protein CMU_015840 [Cryptosporidium muris RN66]|eukprot:XP_002140186.1 hypothetical protein [Cryptosporidium muris RN66]